MAIRLPSRIMKEAVLIRERDKLFGDVNERMNEFLARKDNNLLMRLQISKGCNRD